MEVTVIHVRHREELAYRSESRLLETERTLWPIWCSAQPAHIQTCLAVHRQVLVRRNTLLPIASLAVPDVLAGLHTSDININSPVVSHRPRLQTQLRTARCPLILERLFMSASILEKSGSSDLVPHLSALVLRTCGFLP